MPVLALAVFSFLLFVAIGILGVSAVISEQRKNSDEEHRGKA